MTSTRSRRAPLPRWAVQAYFAIVSVLVLTLASLHVYRGDACVAPPARGQAEASGTDPAQVAEASRRAP